MTSFVLFCFFDDSSFFIVRIEVELEIHGGSPKWPFSPVVKRPTVEVAPLKLIITYIKLTCLCQNDMRHASPWQPQSSD